MYNGVINNFLIWRRHMSADLPELHHFSSLCLWFTKSNMAFIRLSLSVKDFSIWIYFDSVLVDIWISFRIIRINVILLCIRIPDWSISILIRANNRLSNPVASQTFDWYCALIWNRIHSNVDFFGFCLVATLGLCFFSQASFFRRLLVLFCMGLWWRT